MEQTYRIPEANIDRPTEQLDKLAKKAKRLGLVPVVATIAGYEDVPGEQNGIPIVTRYALLTVTGEAPRYAGWTFVASLDFVEGGTVLRTVPGLTVPDTYRNADNYCDHCHSHRQRLGVFVVRHEDGTYRQIGRNCLANFIGGIDPHNLAANAEYLMAVRDLAEDAEDREYGGPGGGRERLSSRFYLSVVAGAIRTWGWMSRTKARELDRTSTAARVDVRIRDMAQGKNAPSFTRGDDDPRDYWTVTDEDSALALAALTYAREYFDTAEPDGEYEYNLQVLTRANSVEWKHTGLLASLLPWYRRKNDLIKRREARAKVDASSVFIGRVGEKLTVTVTVEHITDINGAYGVTHLHRMRDADGNIFCWFSTADKLFEEKTYTLRGTVKGHEEYRDTKQTVLTRCVVVGSCEKCGKDGKRLWTPQGEQHILCAKCAKAAQREEQHKQDIRQAEDDITWAESSISRQEQYLDQLRTGAQESWTARNIDSTTSHLAKLRTKLRDSQEQFAKLTAG